MHNIWIININNIYVKHQEVVEIYLFVNFPFSEHINALSNDALNPDHFYLE